MNIQYKKLKKSEPGSSGSESESESELELKVEKENRLLQRRKLLHKQLLQTAQLNWNKTFQNQNENLNKPKSKSNFQKYWNQLFINNNYDDNRTKRIRTNSKDFSKFRRVILAIILLLFSICFLFVGFSNINSLEIDHHQRALCSLIVGFLILIPSLFYCSIGILAFFQISNFSFDTIPELW
eukprot:TRINITY_DN6344_c0_g1_i2.p1 TRINITY_DN6344_c0_g1~~TRINITY_DN6344_c0_g1_i2.p1  ORF type:complete len:182 (+),score=59.96 TRINITY_DN6344_c0_g1_i2:456-1001(+)